MTFYNRKGMLYARINGKRVSTKLKDTKANRKLFESYAKNDEFFNKFKINSSIPTLVELCEDVLNDLEMTLESTSYRAYRSMFNSRIVPYFAKMLPTEVKPITIKEWYKTFTDKNSIVTCEAILKRAIENAVLSEYIETTPFIIKKPTLKSQYEINPFTIEEIKRILDYKDKSLKNFLGVAFFTGLRTGEICGLKWSDIDFKNKKMSIERQITNGEEKKPKTKSSKAKIDLPIESLPYFKEQQLKTGLREYIFYSSKDQKPFQSSSTFFNPFKKILLDLEIEYRSIYQTRHTFASIRLSLGERLEWVSYMLRHKSPNITQEIYFKYMPELDTNRVIINMDTTQNRHSS